MTRERDAALSQALGEPVWPSVPRFFMMAGPILVVALLGYPFVFTGSFSHHLMIMVFLHAIMAQSWNVIAGMSGQITGRPANLRASDSINSALKPIPLSSSSGTAPADRAVAGNVRDQ